MPQIEAIATVNSNPGISQYADYRGGIGAGGDYIESGYFGSDYYESAPTPGNNEADATLIVDTVLADAAHPAAGSVQEVGVEFWVNGTAVPFEQMVGPWSVERTLNRNIQTFSFTVRVDDGLSYFGSPFDNYGAPTGKQEIDIYGVYRTSQGVKKVPIMKRGLAHLADRQHTPDGVYEQYVGVGPGGRLRSPVTLTVPVGSGVRRDEIVQELLSRAGETEFNFEECNPVLKEVTFVDIDPVSAAQELLDTEGRRLIWDVNGVARNPKIGKPPSRDAQQDSYFEEDYINNPSLTAGEQALTKVTFYGSRKVIEDEDPNGLVTYTFESFIKAIPGNLWMGGTQQSNCTISAISQPPPITTPRTVRRVRTKVTTKCGVTVRQFSETWEYYTRQVARYQADGSGINWNCRGGVHVEAGTAQNDNNPAFYDQYLRFQKIGEIDRRFYYDYSGFTDSLVPGPVPTAFAPSGDETGHLLGSQTSIKTFYNKRNALKSGPPTASWEEEDFIPNVYRLGSFEGVDGTIEILQTTERITETVDSTEDGYISKHTEYREGWHRRPGETYWYGSAKEGVNESRDEDEVFDVRETTITSYESADDWFHIETVTKLGIDDQFVQSQTTPKSGQPPAVEVLPQVTEDELDFFPGYDPSKCISVRAASQPITFTLEVKDLENAHLPNHLKTGLPWAESVEELQAAAELVMEDSLALMFAYDTPANFLLNEGDKIYVKDAPLDVDHEGKIWSISWSSGGFGQPVVARIETKIYAVDISFQGVNADGNLP